MKIVKEYLDFETFKSKCDQTIYPLVLEKVQKAFSNEVVEKMKKIKTVFISSFVFGSILAIAFLFTAYNGAKNNQNITLYAAFGILLTAIIFFIIGIIYSVNYKSIKNRVSRYIATELYNADSIYEKAFANISPDIEYLKSDNKVFLEKLNECELPYLTKKDILVNKPDCPSEPTLVSHEKIGSWLIDNKFPVEYYFLHWQYQVQRKDRVETVNVFRGLIKIYTQALKEKQFSWSLSNEGVSGIKLFRKFQNTIQLEDEQFNRTFALRAFDRQDIFKTFTPYVQQLLVKRSYDNGYTHFAKFTLQTDPEQNSLTYDFNGKKGFMRIDTTITSDPSQVALGFYKDILLDVYSFYYLLCFSYIPLYLD